MRIIKLGFFVSLLMFSLNALDVKKEGLIPMYMPHSMALPGAFLPYNPNIIIVGDYSADIALSCAREWDRASIFLFFFRSE